jgi:lysophospholipase L1-like esterase
MRLSRAFLIAAVLLASCATAPDAQTQVVFDGNSLTAGHGASPGKSYPEQVQLLLPRGYSVINVGVPAQTTSHMMADAATHVDALIQSSARNILVAWEATNDLYFGASADDAYQRLGHYCRDRRNAGFRVIVLTLLPRSEQGTPDDFETSREAVNQRIRADWPTFADAIVDVAAIPELGRAGDELNPRYYADRVHLTDAGYAIIARSVAKAIRELELDEQLPR